MDETIYVAFGEDSDKTPLYFMLIDDWYFITDSYGNVGYHSIETVCNLIIEICKEPNIKSRSENVLVLLSLLLLRKNALFTLLNSVNY